MKREELLKFYRKHNVSLFYIAILIVTTSIEAYIGRKNHDYILFFNILVFGCILIKIARALFWKKYNRFFLFLLCTVINLIVVNGLYSETKLVSALPFLEGIDHWKLLLCGSGAILIFMLCIKLGSSALPKIFSEKGKSFSFPNFRRRNANILSSLEEGNGAEAQNPQVTSSIPPQKMSTGTTPTKVARRWPDIGGIIALVIAIFSLIGLVYVSYKCVIGGDIVAASNLRTVTTNGISTFISLGIVLFLLLLLVICMCAIIVELVKVIKYIVQFAFKGENHFEKNSLALSVKVFSYAVAVLIFCQSTLVDEEEVNRLFDFTVTGDYLTYPLVLILQLAAYLVIAKLVTVAIDFSLLNEKDDSVSKLIKEATRRTIDICDDLFDVVLFSIEDVILFVKAIPNFVSSMYFFVFEDETDDCNKDADQSLEVSKEKKEAQK